MGNSAAGREALVTDNSRGSIDTSTESATSMQHPSNRQSQSQIIYALIARSMPDSDKEVLCEYKAFTNNADVIVSENLSKLTGEVACKSYLVGQSHGLHCMVEDSLWFVCLADIGCGNAQPFQCLQSLRDALKKQHPTGVALCLPPPDFTNEMKKIVTNWNSAVAAKSDRVARMTENVQEVHANLMDSIGQLMEREDKIETLVSRSLILSETSSDFRRGARTLHNRIRWRNMKSFLIMGLVVIVVVAIIVLMSCGGFSFKDC